MMQHVATAKSDIAAFATGLGASPSQKSESNEQFDQLLQGQKSDHSLAIASEGPPPHSPRKRALQQSLDETKKYHSSKVNEEKSKLDKNTASEQTVNYDSQTSTSSQDKTALRTQDNASDGSVGEHTVTNDESMSESSANKLIDELKASNTDAELILSSKQQGIESELTIESASIVAQEWVTLVDNLQKLADIARLTKTPAVDDEFQSQDVSETDLTLTNKVNKDLLEHGVEQQIIDGFNAASDKPGLISPAGKEQNQPSLATFMQQALEQLTDEVGIGQVSPSDIQQKTADLLLEQPEVLNSILSQLQSASQKSGTDSVQQNTLDLAIDKVINKDLLLSKQQSETGGQTAIALDKLIEKAPLLADQPIKTDGQPDLTLVENKALLKAIFIGSENDTRAQDTIKLGQTQRAETLIPKLESVAEQGEFLEQDIQMAQVESNNLLNSNKTEKVAANNDIKNILNLTDSKLEKVLENIAQRVFDNKKTDQPVSQEQISQQVVMPKAAEIISTIESASKDFISALKSGLDEFKNQLSQGREPGMDLKALVADAFAKTSDTAIVNKASVNIEQVVNSVSQVLDFAQTMNRAIEHHHDQIYSASLRDVAQIQGEQSKQIQLNQFDSKFEKAINIAKPEGHQQLAEKVRWMVNTKNLVAEIRLDPAELGSVHVKVAVSGESATVNFVVQSQLARDAVDNATPRLREMLADKGIELGQSSVRQENDGQQSQGDGESARQGGHVNNEAEDIDVAAQVLGQQKIVNGALGGIDYFV